MTMKIRIAELAFFDPKRTPRSLIDKAADTARQQHKGILITYVSIEDLSEIVEDPPPPDFHIEISMTLETKYRPTEAWEERIGNAMTSVRAAKQTFQRTLKELLGFAEFLKDIYGLEPIERGD